MLPAEPHTEPNEDSVSRREFLRAGSLSVVGLSLADRAAWAEFLKRDRQRNCILVLMTGGPSQLETFDPKPDSSSDFRGTLGAIETAVPGMSLSETLPLLAQQAGKFSLLRSLHHTAAPIHETGLQLVQTGRLSWKGVQFPHLGKLVSQAAGENRFAIWPKPLENTGISAYTGQESSEDDLSDRVAGSESSTTQTWISQCTGASQSLRLSHPSSRQAAALIQSAREPESVRRLYGSSRFGELLLQSRLLVEQGVRCVTVNLFDQLGSQITWDAHGDSESGPATIADCRDQLCPAFDRAMSGLLDDLSQRGLLEDTLVIAVGEMGRSPRINSQGGRDHWTRCWSALVAGGDTVGGQVIGTSDDIAAEPVERPIQLGELAATMLRWFGIDGRQLAAVVGKHELPLVPHAPIHELWGATAERVASPEFAAASAEP